MISLEQIIHNSCSGCACLGTKQEQLDCFKFIFREWLQQHKIELLNQYKKDNSNNLAYRINHCNELFDKLEKEEKKKYE